MAILAKLHGLTKLKLPGLHWLVTDRPSMWQQHVEYSLGDEVRGLRSRDAAGKGIPSEGIRE